MNAPIYITRTLAAGAIDPIEAYGKHVSIVSISASTILLGIGSEPPQQIVAGMRFATPKPYSRLTLVNAGLVASTVVFYVADVAVELTSDSLYVAILASLTAIQAKTALQGPYGTLVEVGQTLVAMTGVASTQIIAANALNCEVEIVCDMGNAGYIYLGETNAVIAATSFTELQAGGAWNRKWNGDVWACSTGGVENVRASIWRQ